MLKSKSNFIAHKTIKFYTYIKKVYTYNSMCKEHTD